MPVVTHLSANLTWESNVTNATSFITIMWNHKAGWLVDWGLTL